MSSGAEGDHMRVKNRKTSRQWWDGFPVFEAVAIALTALCTHDCLDNPFLLDDLTKVRDNPDIRSLDGIPSILVYPYLQQSGGIELLRRNDPSRPVTFLSYAIDHSLHGPRPRGFRMTNIGLHLLNCIALRLLMRRLQCWVLSTSQSNHSWGVPEGASIMWLVSPLNVQACAYIYARSELLCTLFSLCSLILACNRTKSGVSLLLDAALFILSLASKQTALVLPALTLFVRTSCGHHLLSSPYNLALSLIYSTLAASYLWLRFEFLGGFGDLEGGISTYSWAEYALCQPWVCLEYVGLLVTGRGLALDHAPTPRDLRDSGKIKAGMLVLFAAGFAAAALVRGCLPFWRQTAPRRLVLLASMWWTCWLIPSSSLVPTVDLMVERRVYCASAAMFACWDALVVGMLQQRLGSTALRMAAMCIVCGVFVSQSQQRHWVMGSEERAWFETLKRYRDSSRANHNFGTIHLDKARGGEKASLVVAQRCFIAVLQSSPTDEYALNNLGTVYDIAGDLHDPDEAARLFERALQLRPAFAAAHYNLGLNHHLRAARARSKKPSAGPPSDEEEGHLLLAEQCYQRASESDPRHVLARNNMGMSLLSRGLVDEAEEQYLLALKAVPDNAMIVSNLALLRSRFASSERARERSLEQRGHQEARAGVQGSGL